MKVLINFKDVDLEVGYDYQPFEPAETGPEAQYPGCCENATINSIHIGDVEVTELLDNYEDEIVNLILEDMHNG